MGELFRKLRVCCCWRCVSWGDWKDSGVLKRLEVVDNSMQKLHLSTRRFDNDRIYSGSGISSLCASLYWENRIAWPFFFICLTNLGEFPSDDGVCLYLSMGICWLTHRTPHPGCNCTLVLDRQLELDESRARFSCAASRKYPSLTRLILISVTISWPRCSAWKGWELRCSWNCFCKMEGFVPPDSTGI